MHKPTTASVSSSRKSSRRTVQVYRKHRTLSELFFMNVALLTLTIVMVGCAFAISEFSAVTKISHDTSVAKDCFNYSTGALFTVPAGTPCQ